MKKYCRILLLSLMLLQLIGANAEIKITIKGLSGKSLENVQKRLDILAKSLPEKLDKATVQGFMRQAKPNIQQALMPYGYFRPKLKSKLKQEQQDWQAQFNITPGSKLLINKIDISFSGAGAKARAFQRYQQHFPLRVGEPLLSAQYEQAKMHLFAIANRLGYLDAHLTKQSISVDRAHYQANIVLHLDTGKRYYFGKIKLEPGPYQADYVYRFFPFKTGQHYSTDKLLRLQENLNNSDNFSKVSVLPLRQQAKQQYVPIAVDLKAKPQHEYLFGLGFGTDTGLRARTGWNWRRVNSRGNRFALNLQASQIQNNASTRYLIPGQDPLTERYSLSTNWQNARWQVGRSARRNIAVGYESTKLRWQQNYSLSLQNEQFKLDDEDQGQNTTLLLPNAHWTYIHGSNLITARHGYKINLTVQGAPKTGFTNVRFAQAELNGKWIIPVGEDYRFITHGSLGATAVNNLSALPLSLRFITGGAHSVRGFNYQSIGPGKYLKIASLELQRRLKNKLYAGVFLDSGAASDDWQHSLNQGAGVSLIYMTPVGPLELSIAKALTRKGQPYRLQFTIGPDLL